ncbi:MAG: hypothetical protein MUF06_12895, partial [Pirellulaceae bacterium]|nr:hypothetical protein [Pirellulaceae bacterium]
MRAFAAEKLAELSKDDVSPAALDRAKNITTQAVGELFAQAQAADEDKLFDLRMKSPLDFKIEFALSQGWLTSQEVDAARTAEAEAIAEFRNQSPEH